MNIGFLIFFVFGKALAFPNPGTTVIRTTDGVFTESYGTSTVAEKSTATTSFMNTETDSENIESSTLQTNSSQSITAEAMVVSSTTTENTSETVGETDTTENTSQTTTTAQYAESSTKLLETTTDFANLTTAFVTDLLTTSPQSTADAEETTETESTSETSDETSSIVGKTDTTENTSQKTTIPQNAESSTKHLQTTADFADLTTSSVTDLLTTSTQSTADTEEVTVTSQTTTPEILHEFITTNSPITHPIDEQTESNAKLSENIKEKSPESTIKETDEQNEIYAETTTPKLVVTKEIFFDKPWHYDTVERSRNPILKTMGGNHRLPPNFNDTIRYIMDMQQREKIILDTTEDNTILLLTRMTCTPSCHSTMSLISYYVKNNKSEETIMKTVKSACIAFKLLNEAACESFAKLYLPDMIYVFRRADITPGEVCSFLSGENCGEDYDKKHDWKIEIPKQLVAPEKFADKKPIEFAPTFKVLHLSDTHFDPDYREGSNAECPLPLCCQAQNGMAKTKRQGAGKWGDYRKCDMPKRTLVNMFHHINHTHPDIDYILWTGDTVPHDIWNQTKADNLKILNETFRLIYESFPNIPIFPAVGNHEAAPVNNFALPFVDDPNYSVSWLYDELERIWFHWLPQSSRETVKHGAFYSVLLRTGLRIISINTNYCNNQNIWLILNSTDAANELQWLVYELLAAEANNEKVHIIGHISPGGDDCMLIWSRNYYEIIERFQSTVTGQFFAHTHTDEFKILYDRSNNPMNIAYLGPSVSTFMNLNPGYRLYYIDGDHEQTTRRVLDHETWIMNLQETNANDSPRWFKLYSAKLAYGMDDLSPKDWHQFYERLSTNGDMFDLFYKFYYKGNHLRPDYDARKKLKILCELRGQRLHLNQTVCS